MYSNLHSLSPSGEVLALAATSISVNDWICDILLANVANESFCEAETPLPVIAFATCCLPLLTEDFKLSISVDALHWIVEGCIY